jgi:hypothetical protein
MATLTRKDNIQLYGMVEAAKPRPPNKLMRLVRQPRFTRSQATVAPFQLYYARTGLTMPAVTTLPIADLIAMLDRNHTAGSKFAVVSKPGRSARRGARFRNLTAVLDVANNRLYRASHEDGLVVFWRRLARNRGGFVDYVSGSEAYYPQPPAVALALMSGKVRKPTPVFYDFNGQEIQSPFSCYRRG